MPELPEVETMVQGLRPLVEGETLLAVEAHDPKLVHVRPALDLPVEVRALARRGKYALFDLGDRLLVIHLRMSGRLAWGASAPEGRVRLALRFPDGAVYLVDPRRLGTAEVVREFKGELGPEPFGDLSWLPTALKGSRMPIKLWLMDQRKIAGIGNIYAAEILFRAGIDPRRPARGLEPAEVRRLENAIPEVLQAALAEAGTTLPDGVYQGPNGERGGFAVELSVYGREGEPCPTCGAPVQRMILGGRGTYFCPCCQR
ncbi:bifunctional DNA-formamidopyrimidine glycosylase/DNA-(apurinic or apyrimidinic site) lyase [Candidatus Bipolaricaulota bacterium]|nr:bifunctional DNA-formamidopyrimidine glycosylase/DNA-(apurinic or apyrimidinic site) lyase [Candidatus Bipolaricaulota bacterium]